MGGFKIAIHVGGKGLGKKQMPMDNESAEGEPELKPGEVDEPEPPVKSKGGFKSFIKGKKK